MGMYAKVEIEGMGWIVVQTVDEIIEALKSDVMGDENDFDWWKPGQKITITTIEMTEEEFEALPEFPGF